MRDMSALLSTSIAIATPRVGGESEHKSMRKLDTHLHRVSVISSYTASDMRLVPMVEYLYGALKMIMAGQKCRFILFEAR